MQRNPFKFLDAYTKEDADLFYGRESESEEIFSRLLSNRLLLIYGPSGSGKSSIVQCGVSNHFADTDWKPIFIRRKDNNILQSIHDELEKYCLTPFKDNASLSRKIYSLYLDFLTPVYLIFDQFEELFIFGDQKEKNEFAKEIASVLAEEEMNLHIIFVVWEEYLARLTEIENTIPDIFRNHIRIEKMKYPQALIAIEKPCQQVGLKIEEGVAENILTKLYRSGELELSYLQVYLDKLYKNALKRDSGNLQIRHQDVEQIGEIGDILQNFLEEQISLSPDSDMYRSFLKTMISPQGTKKIISVHDARNSLAILGFDAEEKTLKEMLKFLVDRRIIKEFEKGELYELRHDSLAEKIKGWLSQQEKEFMEIQSSLNQRVEDYQSRRILLDEQFLEALLPYEYKLTVNPLLRELIQKSKTKIQKQKRSRKNALRISIGSTALFIILFGFFLWALYEKDKAEDAYIQTDLAKKQAEEKSNEALRSKNISDSLKVIAEREGEKADSLMHLEKSAREDAEYHKMLANLARDTAELQKKYAIQENQKSNKVLAQLYFYNDKFALTVKKRLNQYLYGYIDKQGNTVIPFKYDEASPFNPKTGFATVKRDSYYYLIDTTAQKEYLLCQDTNDLNDKIAAINLSSMHLKEIPKILFTYKQLKIIFLSENLIEQIPAAISIQSDSLIFLDISHNKISTNNLEIWSLDCLSVLNLSYNRLESLPGKIGNLIKLRELYLNNNRITKIPSEIGDLKNLTILNLSYNELTTLPVEMGNLYILRELDLTYNKLTLVPAEIGNLGNLRKLSLTINKLDSLPVGIGNLKKLNELSLSSNKLTALPAQIGSLNSLTMLNLSNNELDSLPAEIGNLTNLKELYLNNNHIAYIPVEIGNLRNLTLLDLSSNELTILPAEIRNLKSLSRLNLSDNNFPDSEKEQIQQYLPNCEIIW